MDSIETPSMSSPIEALHEIREVLVELMNKIDAIMVKEAEEAESSDEDYRSQSPSPELEHGVLPYYRTSTHPYEINGRDMTIFDSTLPEASPLLRRETGYIVPVTDLDAPSRSVTPEPIKCGSYKKLLVPKFPE